MLYRGGSRILIEPDRAPLVQHEEPLDELLLQALDVVVLVAVPGGVTVIVPLPGLAPGPQERQVDRMAHIHLCRPRARYSTPPYRSANRTIGSNTGTFARSMAASISARSRGWA